MIHVDVVLARARAKLIEELQPALTTNEAEINADAILRRPGLRALATALVDEVNAALERVHEPSSRRGSPYLDEALNSGDRP